MNTSTHRGFARLLSVAACLHAGLAVAQRVPDMRDSGTLFELRTGAMRSDNIARTPENPLTGTLYFVGLGLDAKRDGRRLDVTARADLDWFRYPQDVFRDALLGYFNGLALYDLVPERLQWRVEETFTQRATNPFLAPTPDNLGEVNDFSTGPRLSIPLSGAMSARVGADYSVTHQQELANSSRRYGGSLALVRDLSRSNELSLNLGTQHVAFDDIPQRDYDLRQVFVAYTSGGGRGSVRAELGYSTLDLQGASSNGLLTRLDAVRRLSPASTVGVYLAREFSDAGEIFRRRLDVTGSPNAPPTFAVADVFEDRSTGVRWNFLRGRTQITVDVAHTEERYERAVDSDRDFESLNVNLQRRMTPRLTLRLQGHHDREKFQTVDFDARETSGDLALEWAFGRALGLTLRQEWRKRTSSDLLTEYMERRIGATLFYRPTRRL